MRTNFGPFAIYVEEPLASARKSTMESAGRASVNCQALKILAVCPFPPMSLDMAAGIVFMMLAVLMPILLAQSVDEMSPARRQRRWIEDAATPPVSS
jgi:hypothetical protein